MISKHNNMQIDFDRFKDICAGAILMVFLY